MTSNRLIAWQLIAQSFLLLLIYAASSLFLSAKFLPDDPLAVALPFMQASAVTHISLELAILTGLLGTAVFFLLESPSKLLTWLYRIWTGFLIVTVLLALIGAYEGRHRLELPILLDIVLIVLLLGWLFLIWQGKQNEGKEIFSVGILVLIIAYVLSLLPIQSPLYDRVLRVAMVEMRYFIAYPLMGLALASWLKPDLQTYRAAAALLIMGALTSISPLTATNILSLGWLPAFLMIITLIYLLRLLISSDTWANLSLVFLTLSFGLLGISFAVPELGKFMLGTQLSDLHYQSIQWAVLAMLFSFVCAQSQDSRLNLRFWLIAVGLLGAALALGIAGMMQVFMERSLSIGYLDVQTLVVPLYIFSLVAFIIAGIGLAFHAWRFLRQNLHLSELN